MGVECRLIITHITHRPLWVWQLAMKDDLVPIDRRPVPKGRQSLSRSGGLTRGRPLGHTGASSPVLESSLPLAHRIRRAANYSNDAGRVSGSRAAWPNSRCSKFIVFTPYLWKIYCRWASGSGSGVAFPFPVTVVGTVAMTSSWLL